MESGSPPPATPSPEPVQEATPKAGPPKGSPGPLLGEIAVAIVVVALLAGAVWGLPALTANNATPSPVASDNASPVAVPPSSLASPGPSGNPSSPGPRPAPTVLPGGPFASSGSIVVEGGDGSLRLIAASGRSIVLEVAGDHSFLFPAWSPDGSRIAVIRYGTGTNEILVYDVAKAVAVDPAKPVEPVVIFKSSSIGPFYLSWTPNGRDVSYLADDPAGLALRIAPADGSAPLDGSGPGSKVRTGNPFYFDWIDDDRLLAHVGTGPDALLDELRADGTPATPAIPTPGDFRSAVVSNDQDWIGYVRAGTGGASDVVLAARDGSSERTMPVFGTAAVTFDPVGDRIASIGPIETPQTAYAVPLGPLRILDAKTGKARTLVDGNVVGFWWSPDGKTIAALRVATPGAGPSGNPGASTGASTAAASAAPAIDVRLLFVDVASGQIRSQPVVDPGQLFIDQFLLYFDQYALSHHLWAPDSSSFLMPVVDRDGTTRVAVLFANDDPPVMIDGSIAFWSP